MESLHDPGLEYLSSLLFDLSSSNLTLSETPVPNWISWAHCIASCLPILVHVLLPRISLYVAFLINKHLPSNLSSTKSFPLISSTVPPDRVTSAFLLFLPPACSWSLYVFPWWHVFVYIPLIPCLFLISFPCSSSVTGTKKALIDIVKW